MKILKKVAAFASIVAFFAQNLIAQSAKEAETAFQLGMLDKAVTMYESLLKSTPTDPNLGLQLGNLYLAQGKQDKALVAFSAAAAAKPDDNLVNVANARIALMSGNTEESVKLTNKSIKSAKGKNANLLRQTGESFFFGKTKNLKRAAEILGEANSANTKDFNTLMSLGWVWKELIDGGKAVTFYEFAAALEPTNPLPIFRVGQVYKQSRNFSKYEESLKKALEIDPNFTIAARDLGDYYYRANKMAPAKTMYDKFIGIGKDVTIEDRMQYANILFLNKDFEKLVPYVEDVIKTDGSRNYLRRLLGYAAYETDNFDKGLAIMSEYFNKVKPENIISDDFEFMGKLLEKKNQDSLALDNYLRAARMDGAKWKLYKNAGKLALNKLKRPKDAIEYFKINLDSLKLSAVRGEEGPSGEDYYYLGLANERAKNYKIADENYQKVTELNPSAMTGWKARANVWRNLEPDVLADHALATTYGTSKPYWEKVIEIGSADKVKYLKDLKNAYGYLSFYEFVKGNLAGATENNNKVLELDPADEGATQWKTQLDAGLTVAEMGTTEAKPTENRPLTPFNKIVVSGGFNSIKLREGVSESIQIFGIGADKVLTVVNENGLKIATQSGTKASNFDLVIVFKMLTEIGSSGGTDIISESPIKTDNFAYNSAGSGDFTATLDVKSFEVNIAGSGDAILAGKADAISINIAGSGDVVAADCKSINAEVNIVGSGDAVVNADTLDKTVLGSGSVVNKKK